MIMSHATAGGEGFAVGMWKAQETKHHPESTVSYVLQHFDIS
jgi:hypothetical protein